MLLKLINYTHHSFFNNEKSTFLLRELLQYFTVTYKTNTYSYFWKKFKNVGKPTLKIHQHRNF
jgi:hypothetical protein